MPKVKKASSKTGRMPSSDIDKQEKVKMNMGAGKTSSVGTAKKLNRSRADNKGTVSMASKSKTPGKIDPNLAAGKSSAVGRAGSLTGTENEFSGMRTGFKSGSK